MNSSHECQVLIVGAGITGLMAAHSLQSRGLSVIVVDQAERVGGRIITENVGGGWADTGAQFFTAREPAFQAYVDTWLAEGLVFEWATGWSDGVTEVVEDGHSRYAAYEGLTAVPRRLAQGIVVHKSVRITAVQPAASGWQAQAEAGEFYYAQALILTPPVPLSLALVDAGDVSLTPADRQALAQITYAPGLTGVLVADGQVNLPPPGAVQRPDHPISWIADNQAKGISPRVRTLTVQVNPHFSQLWQEAPDAELAGMFRRELRPFLAPDTRLHTITIHRWAHALPLTLHPQRTLLAGDLLPLAFAGDAFNGPRVEGAALSGLAAADKIAQEITNE